MKARHHSDQSCGGGRQSVGLAKALPPESGPVGFLRGLVLAGTLALLPVLAVAQEIFPRLIINGGVVTNVSVTRSNPVELVLHWDGGGGGICKRQELPPELAARYPYDAGEAERWLREKAEKDRCAADQKRAQLVQELRRKERFLVAEIERVDKELHKLNEITPILAQKARGTRRGSPEHVELNRTRDHKVSLIKQRQQLETDLENARKCLRTNG